MNPWNPPSPPTLTLELLHSTADHWYEFAVSKFLAGISTLGFLVSLVSKSKTQYQRASYLIWYMNVCKIGMIFRKLHEGTPPEMLPGVPNKLGPALLICREKLKLDVVVADITAHGLWVRTHIIMRLHMHYFESNILCFNIWSWFFWLQLSHQQWYALIQGTF